MKRRRGSVTKPSANINVTSLLDITFVLLISFMVITPALKSGVEIELPKVRESNQLKAAKPVDIEVKSGLDGPDIYVNGQVSTLDALVDDVQAARTSLTEEGPVTLTADRRVDWEQMASIIARLKTAGIENVGIVTEPLKET